ncbi:unnamed protein product [Parnassius apollo]|uniref:(apollo) hypothetical protein n=1 Tax=Parnassius apollo TaxID=110799 RepID=A0A8S3Y8C0_PARAO|nr:unnamed protein product [Parnassius apollo]
MKSDVSLIFLLIFGLLIFPAECTLKIGTNVDMQKKKLTLRYSLRPTLFWSSSNCPILSNTMSSLQYLYK